MMDWTLEQIARVRDLAAEGSSAREISEQIGHSRSAVFRKLAGLKRGATNPTRGFPWDDVAIARLRGFCAAGATFSQIADELGCTRNAAIGKAHRLGLYGKPRCVDRLPKLLRHHVPATRSNAVTHKTSAVATESGITTAGRAREDRGAGDGMETRPLQLTDRQAARPARGADEKEPASLNLTILDLTNSTCRWPHGINPPFTYCGHETFGNPPYCPYHTRLACASSSRSVRSPIFSAIAPEAA